MTDGNAPLAVARVTGSRPRGLLLRRAVMLGVWSLAAAGCRREPPADPRVVSEHVHALYGAIRVEQLSAPVASRLTAYAATALYAGFAAADPALTPLTGILRDLPALPATGAPRAVDGTLVAIAAERTVLEALLREALPTTRSALARMADSLTATRVVAGVTPAQRDSSVALGARIGAAIVQWANADGFAGTRGRPYTPPAGPGRWRNDAPPTTYTTQNLSGASQFIALDNPANHQRSGNTSDRGLILSRPKSAGTKTLPAANIAGATEPYWAELRPFVLPQWDACPLDAPPAYSTDTASTLARNARDVASVRAALTPEQRTIALYWADNAGESGTPVGHWLSIASQLISERHLSAHDAARVVLVTAIAQADAFIAAWGYKYRFNLLRPRMFIRATMDAAWEPLIPTPPFPEYPSGHSTQSMAAATVLAATLGDIPFSDSTSIALGHAVRAFPSLRAASEEAGLSRVYGGIHFPAGNIGGRTLGACVGAQVARAFGLRLIAGAQ